MPANCPRSFTAYYTLAERLLGSIEDVQTRRSLADELAGAIRQAVDDWFENQPTTETIEGLSDEQRPTS